MKRDNRDSKDVSFSKMISKILPIPIKIPAGFFVDVYEL